MGTYLPVSISNGRIPVLNCDIKERRRRNIHLIIYFSGSNISLNIMYVLSLRVFSIDGVVENAQDSERAG